METDTDRFNSSELLKEAELWVAALKFWENHLVFLRTRLLTSRSTTLIKIINGYGAEWLSQISLFTHSVIPPFNDRIIQHIETLEKSNSHEDRLSLFDNHQIYKSQIRQLKIKYQALADQIHSALATELKMSSI